MFIYSLKASTIRFFGIVCVALAALIALVAFVPTYVSGNGNADAPAAHLPEETSAPGGQTPGGAESVTYRYDKVRSADDAAAFLGQFGWVVDAGSAETAQVTIPAEFDKVFAGYNELQKQQGLDLTGTGPSPATRLPLPTMTAGKAPYTPTCWCTGTGSSAAISARRMSAALSTASRCLRRGSESVPFSAPDKGQALSGCRLHRRFLGENFVYFSKRYCIPPRFVL